MWILNAVRLPISPLRHYTFIIKFERKYSTPSIKLAKYSRTIPTCYILLVLAQLSFIKMRLNDRLMLMTRVF